jgi:hypothetical protein
MHIVSRRLFQESSNWSYNLELKRLIHKEDRGLLLRKTERPEDVVGAECRPNSTINKPYSMQPNPNMDKNKNVFHLAFQKSSKDIMKLQDYQQGAKKM